MSDFAIDRDTAEQFLDEMLSAEESVDYDAWTRRFEQRFLVHFTRKRFERDMKAIREDLGDYRHREYMGCLKGITETGEEPRFPGCVRYVWKGVFELNETLIVVGLHERDNQVYVNQFNYNH